MKNLRLFKKSIFIIPSIAVLMTVTFIGHNFSFDLWPANLENKIEIPDVMTYISA